MMRDRLAHSDPAVRRIAILDLIRDACPDSDQLLISHLRAEPDEKAALAIIDHLERTRLVVARRHLLDLYDDPATPAAVAVRAIRAHDAIGSD